MSIVERTPSERLRELGLSLPDTPPAAGKYLPGVRAGNLLFVSGQTPTRGGRPVMTGYVGREVSLKQAREGARLAALNSLAQVVSVIGSLDRVRRIVRVTGYVRSAPGFGDHARSSIGVAELPGEAPIEIELLVEVDS